MKKRYRVVFAFLAAVLLLCSCKANDAALPNEIRSQDGAVKIYTPENWSKYEAEAKDNLVLAAQDDAGSFVQVFWYPSVKDKTLKAKDYADKTLEYYGEDAQIGVTSVKVNDKSGYYFAYLKQGLDKDGNTYTYKGYEYFLAMKNGVVEVDIFCRYTDTEPTNDQLIQLRSIAESVQVKE